MKKQILLCTITVFSFMLSQAQIQKKDILLGGTLGFNSGSNSSNGNPYSTTSNVNVAPEIGYAIGKNAVIGIRGSFNHSSAKYPDPNAGYSQKQTGFTAAAFWRQFFSINQKVGWFTDVEGGYTSNTASQENQAYKTHNNGFAASASPGFYYLATPGIMLNASVGGVSYNQSRSVANGQETGKYSGFNVTLLNSFIFGIDFILHKSRP